MVVFLSSISITKNWTLVDHQVSIVAHDSLFFIVEDKWKYNGFSMSLVGSDSNIR